MSRYIDADELEDELYEHEFSNWCDKDEVSELIDNMPTADVAEVRHGHWIRGRKICDIPNDSDYEWECSECYHTDVHNAKVQVDYCWHCGAKMDGEEQEHD